MGRTRKHYSPEFKVKAVLEVLKGEKTATQLSGELGVHPIILSDWKKHFLATAGRDFERANKSIDSRWRLNGLKKIGVFDLGRRRILIDQDDETLSLTKQCELLSVTRSGWYYKPRVPEEDLRLMRAIDEQYLKTEIAGIFVLGRKK